MKIFRHSLAVVLALLVVIASSSFTVNLHYCGNNLQEISINPAHVGCNMQQAVSLKNCDQTSTTTNISKVDTCCKNHQIKSKSKNQINDSKAKNENVFTQTFVFINSYFASFFSSNNNDEPQEEENDTSVVPLLKAGLYILFEQFRN